MLDRFRRAGLTVPGLFALVALAILLSLGSWQLQRKAWKQGLMAQISARATAAPIPLTEALRRAGQADDVEYLRVRVVGKYWHDREVHLHAIEGSTAGWHVLTPLETADGTVVFINRGFVPNALKSPSSRAGGLVAGEAEFNGLVRRYPNSKALFTPENAPMRSEWYWLDRAAMQTAARIDSGKRTAPFIVDMERVTVAVPPAGGATRLTLPNRHFEYALTWFGLAATLVGVYAAFAWARLTRPET
jgi:surfeit locus 1 family protein